MSLRAKLTWAFVLVVVVALIPAALVLNLGISSSMQMTGQGMGHMMGPGTAQGMGQGMGPGTGRISPGAQAEQNVQLFPDVQTAPEYLARVRTWSVWAGLAALLLAGGAGWFISERITRSVRHLRDAAHGLDLRDLSRRVPAEGRDEIAELGLTFNKMADRLEAEERSRRQLLADVAHELRHPLAVMKGRLDLMQEGRVGIDQEALLPLQDEVIRLTRLVGDLRDLSLAEVGGLSLQIAPVDLARLLRTLTENMEPVAAAKDVALTATVTPGLPAVAADPDRLRQVLVNLIANALQYTGPGGKVSIDAKPVAAAAGGAVQIAICDTGPGIAEADLPHLFDRFYRGDKSRSRATGGSGLGLAIVRSLVELHRGSVTVQSKEGVGTTFTVTLPAGEGITAA
jgi:two-component system, OmpR family, sensor histidine kinase BaeS